MRELNCMVQIFPNYCIFQDIQTRRVLGRGTKKGGLHYLDNLKAGNVLLSVSNNTDAEKEILLWHKRLGHPSLGYLKKLYPKLFVNFNHENFMCEIYIKVKNHRSTYLSSDNKRLAPFDLIHTDVWGPSPINSKYSYQWFVIFIDDFSQMTWLYLLKTKEEVKEIFKVFMIMVKTQFEKKN
jgi:GAG-pre-integrase domain